MAYAADQLNAELLNNLIPFSNWINAFQFKSRLPAKKYNIRQKTELRKYLYTIYQTVNLPFSAYGIRLSVVSFLIRRGNYCYRACVWVNIATSCIFVQWYESDNSHCGLPQSYFTVSFPTTVNFKKLKRCNILINQVSYIYLTEGLTSESNRLSRKNVEYKSGHMHLSPSMYIHRLFP